MASFSSFFWFNSLPSIFPFSPFQTFLDFFDASKANALKPTPKAFFLKLLGDRFFIILAEQTNIYMRGPYSARHSTFTADDNLTTPEEISAFVGCLLALHMSPRPDMNMAWTPDYALPIVRRVFSRDRFLLLLGCIHFVDNSTLPKNKKCVGFETLQKLRPLMTALIENSRHFYVCGAAMSSDEAMIQSKVRTPHTILSLLIHFFVY
jgi:hypothetical protein